MPTDLTKLDTDESSYLAELHKTSMTQEQRKELIRIITMDFSEGSPSYTKEEAAGMTDRQVHLAWLVLCAYISVETYKREFDKCVGEPIALTRPKSS